MDGTPAGGARPEHRPDEWGAGADGYDAHFARYTGLYAGALLDALGVGRGTRFLDVAAGTGALSVTARDRGAVVTATDFAPGMVDVLRRRLGGPGSDAEVAVMDAASLDLPDDAFDAAGSTFGVMFVPDVLTSLAELVRVVQPGGRVGTTTWHLDGFHLSGMIAASLASALPGLDLDPPEPAWAAVGRTDGLHDALVAAGLVDVGVQVVVRGWRIEDPIAFFRSMADWSVPMRPLVEQLTPEVLDVGAEAFAAALSERTVDGAVPVEALVGSGRVG